MNHQNSRSASYAAAGADVTAGYESVRRIKPMVESTYIPGVLGTLGGFGGMFAPDLSGMKKPVLVSGGGTNLQALMDSDIPGGPIIAQKSVAVLPDDTPKPCKSGSWSRLNGSCCPGPWGCTARTGWKSAAAPLS